MIYIDKFTYKTSVKNLESAPFIDEEKVIEDALWRIMWGTELSNAVN